MDTNKYRYQPAHKRPGSKTILRTTLNGHYNFGPDPFVVWWSGYVQPLGTNVNDTSSWPFTTVADLITKGKEYQRFSYVENAVSPTFLNTHSHHYMNVPTKPGVYQFVISWNQTLYGNSVLQKQETGVSGKVEYFNVFHMIVDDSAPASVDPCYKTCVAPKLPCGTSPGACYDPSTQTCIDSVIIDKSMASNMGDIALCSGWDGSKRAYNVQNNNCIEPYGALPEI